MWHTKRLIRASGIWHLIRASGMWHLASDKGIWPTPDWDTEDVMPDMDMEPAGEQAGEQSSQAG